MVLNPKLKFSPNQLVYGQGCSLIGITDGDLATDECVTTSEAVDRHFKEIDWIFRRLPVWINNY